MSKGPILVLGAAAVVGIAIAAKRQSATDSAATAPPPVPGKSLQDMTIAQRGKLESWAKKKGVPLQQAYDLAKQVFSTKF